MKVIKTQTRIAHEVRDLVCQLNALIKEGEHIGIQIDLISTKNCSTKQENQYDVRVFQEIEY